MPQNAKNLALGELSGADMAAWARFRAGDKTLASPYFSPDYLTALETVHPGIRVMRISDGDAPMGFLPFRPDMLGTARPPDGLLGDLHGLIAPPGQPIDLTGALQATSIGGYAFSAVPYQQARHGLSGLQGEGNQIVDLSKGHDAYLRERTEASSSFRRMHRKVERLLAEPGLTIEHGTFDEDVFARLIELKQDGYAEAGHFDIFQLSWPAALLRELAARDYGEVKGVLSVMRREGRLMAACYCMRSDTVLHYWFPGYEKAFAAEKPGHAMLFSLIEWAARQGIREVHLGLGNVQYKRQMATFAAPVRQGALAVGLPQRAVAGFHGWSHLREARGRPLGIISAKLARKCERVALTGRLSA